MAKHEINVVILEEPTSTGWSGMAEITCPHCGMLHVVQVATVGAGRGVSFWDAGPGHAVEHVRVNGR